MSFATSLSFEAVTHRYGTVQTLRGLDLTAEAGEILCLLGSSGSGKTTTLRIAAGLEREHGGRVALSDRVISGGGTFVPPERRGIAYMFQDFALFPHMSVRANVAFGLSTLQARRANEVAEAALDRVGLAALSERYPDALSGGQQQRVALARALAPRPGIVLMDEPFSGLDARLKDQVRAETLTILRETRATAIIVTHDAEEAMRLGDRIALMKDGGLLQIGTTRELYRAPNSLFAAAFFSDLNTLPGTVRNGEVECALGRFAAPGIADGPATVALRPTAFEHHPDGDIRCKIIARRFVGNDEAFTLAVDDLPEPLRVRLRDRVVPGDARRLGLSIRREDVLVFESVGASA